jgi:hypothetical protein
MPTLDADAPPFGCYRITHQIHECILALVSTNPQAHIADRIGFNSTMWVLFLFFFTSVIKPLARGFVIGWIMQITFLYSREWNATQHEVATCFLFSTTAM